MTQDQLANEAARAQTIAGELMESIERVIEWCDERRNAPDWTTLGMVQFKLREAIDAAKSEFGQ